MLNIIPEIQISKIKQAGNAKKIPGYISLEILVVEGKIEFHVLIFQGLEGDIN